jgi:hypothetical protein
MMGGGLAGSPSVMPRSCRNAFSARRAASYVAV